MPWPRVRARGRATPGQPGRSQGRSLGRAREREREGPRSRPPRRSMKPRRAQLGAFFESAAGGGAPSSSPASRPRSILGVAGRARRWIEAEEEEEEEERGQERLARASLVPEEEGPRRHQKKHK
jgi:hypothetical protein